MPPIQFSHANGFSAKTYRYFFECLKSAPISYVEQFGMGKYPAGLGWEQISLELIEDIERKHTEPVIGIGHSLGGVLTLLAAQQRPELFRQIILFDPPFFRPWKQWGMRIATKTGLMQLVPPMSKAKSRRTEFDNFEQAYTYFKSKALFRHFHEECFKDYVQYGLKPAANGKGLTLSIPALVEFRFFMSTPNNIGTMPLQVPATLLRAQQGSVLSEKDIKWYRQAFPKMTFIEVKGSHLFPFEKPEEVGALVRSLIV